MVRTVDSQSTDEGSIPSKPTNITEVMYEKGGVTNHYSNSYGSFGVYYLSQSLFYSLDG